MTQYDIVAVFWEDHIQVTRSELINDPDELFEHPMLSIGLLYKETDKSILLVHDFESNEKATYIAILKSTIVAMQKYGQIELLLGGE